MTGESVAGAVVPPIRAPAVIRAYFNSINAEDFEQLATIWADDAELEAVGARPRRGCDEILEFYSGAFEPWSTHYDDPRRAVVAADLVVVQIVFKGTATNGKQIEFPAVDIFELKGAQIRKLSIWYDLVWVRKQLS
jgi:ketosteroid isomerase-like protein